MFELRFGYPTDEDPTNAGYYMQVIDFVPRTSYIGAGIEENGDLCLVAVMADGWDKESQNIHSVKLASVSKGILFVELSSLPPFVEVSSVPLQLPLFSRNTSRDHPVVLHLIPLL